VWSGSCEVLVSDFIDQIILLAYDDGVIYSIAVIIVPFLCVCVCELL
jgi:hypothetical protein